MANQAAIRTAVAAAVDRGADGPALLGVLDDAAEAWAKAGPQLPLATTSLWQLSQQIGKP